MLLAVPSPHASFTPGQSVQCFRREVSNGTNHGDLAAVIQLQVWKMRHLLRTVARGIGLESGGDRVHCEIALEIRGWQWLVWFSGHRVDSVSRQVSIERGKT